MLHAANYELYEDFDPGSFDRSFTKDELVIGMDIGQREGRDDERLLLADPGENSYGERFRVNGSAVWLGVPGYIANLSDRINFRPTSLLDSKVDQGENFVIVSISTKASRAIALEGGLNGGVNKVLRDLWLKHLGALCHRDFAALVDRINGETVNVKTGLFSVGQLRKDFNSDGFRAVFDLVDTPEKWRKNCAAPTGDAPIEAVHIRSATRTAHPVLAETQVFVHPLGVMSFGEHIARLLKINPRVPYEIRVYSDQPEVRLFNKYRETFLQECQRDSIQLE